MQLTSADYHERIAGGIFNRDEFHHYPQRYRAAFQKFYRHADMLIAGAYWNPDAPPMFTCDDMREDDFNIKIIADITCDINGSIPSTKISSTIPEPLYDYDPQNDTVHAPFTHDKYITTMAVDNLPCELPRSASEEFGRDLIDKILTPLFGDDSEGIIQRATIATNGKLTPHFSYLQVYVDKF